MSVTVARARPVVGFEGSVSADNGASIIEGVLGAEVVGLRLVTRELGEAGGVHEFSRGVKSNWRQGGDGCGSAGGLIGGAVDHRGRSGLNVDSC